jgi:pimeloyl-ACP methyl ester carboxylesterase
MKLFWSVIRGEPMKKSLLALILLTAAAVLPARAEVLLLVHGYLGGAHSWDSSGITTILQQRGWQRAGIYLADPVGVRLIPAAGIQASRKFYAADLASDAPMRIQVTQLQGILNAIEQAHPDEPLIIVGHSAGGVAARAALVLGSGRNVKSLITIASPHLGTVRAEQALDVTDIPFPFSVVADFFGGRTYDIARRSRSLYHDLVRPYPGSFLYWLNAQPHPDIGYISVVRAQTGTGWGDYVVPAYSQDMNNVAVLRGKSTLVTIPGQHALEPADGSVILDMLAKPAAASKSQ